MFDSHLGQRVWKLYQFVWDKFPFYGFRSEDILWDIYTALQLILCLLVLSGQTLLVTVTPSLFIQNCSICRALYDLH